MGYLSGSNITNTTGVSFSIAVNGNNHTFSLSNGDSYTDVYYIERMCVDYTGSYNRVLVAGLGLGVIPQWFAKEKGATVDVIENNSELITTIQSIGYLDSKINIIEADIFNYQPSGSYDLGVMDIWFDCYNSTYYQQTGSLKTLYSSSCNMVSIPYH